MLFLLSYPVSMPRGGGSFQACDARRRAGPNAVGFDTVRVLVTGGAGYIGSVTAPSMIAAGHLVVVVDDLSTGHADAVPEGARLVEFDLADTLRMTDLLREESVEAVVHFAALSLVGESMRGPLRHYRTNAGGAGAAL